MHEYRGFFAFRPFRCFRPVCPVEPISVFYGQDGQELNYLQVGTRMRGDRPYIRAHLPRLDFSGVWKQHPPKCRCQASEQICCCKSLATWASDSTIKNPSKSLRYAGCDARLQGFRTPTWPELVDNQGYSHPREEPSRPAQQSLHSM